MSLRLLAFVIAAGIGAGAFATVTPTLLANMDVWSVQRVAAAAVRLPRVASAHRFTAQDILAKQYGFQMGGIEAGFVAAKVIDGLVRFKRAHRERVRETMRKPHITFPVDATIAGSRTASPPFPASSMLAMFVKQPNEIMLFHSWNIA